MTLESFLAGVETWPLSVMVQESDWLFPALEAAHVIAICLVVGSIMIVDLRLLGLTSKSKPISELAAEILPWTWSLFVVALLTGGGMFLAKATTYYENTPFRWKMVLLLLVGLNMLVFHATAYRSVHLWDRDKPTLAAAKVAGALSLAMWIGIVVCGRWIAFVERF